LNFLAADSLSDCRRAFGVPAVVARMPKPPKRVPFTGRISLPRILLMAD
jgi:hypothetical protein